MLKIQFYEQNGRRVVALAVAGGEWSTVYWDNLPRCIQDLFMRLSECREIECGDIPWIENWRMGK